jgi:hypothetical protein
MCLWFEFIRNFTQKSVPSTDGDNILLEYFSFVQRSRTTLIRMNCDGHANMQEIRINGLFFENSLHWQKFGCYYLQYVKSIHITGLWGPECSGRLRLPDSMKSALQGGMLSALATGHFYPQEYPGTHFQEAESTLGTWNCRMPRKKSSDTTADRSRDLPSSSVAP